MNEDFYELILVCASWQRAQQAVDQLLADELVAKTEILPTQTAQKVHVIVRADVKNLKKIKTTVDRLSNIAIVSSVSLVQ
jgi:hypothetical protein